MECEITFSKRFKIREDQNPADIGKMYVETMGFTIVDVAVLYDPTFGDDIDCECGHPYYRHFDSYEDMAPVGCKYCHGFEEGVSHRRKTPLPENVKPSDEEWYEEYNKHASICTGFKRAIAVE